MKCTSTVLALFQLMLLVKSASPTVTPSDIASSTDPKSPELLEKTWAVSLTNLDKLEIQVAGNVFVDYDSSLQSNTQLAAKIVMRASSSKLLSAVDVTDIDGEDATVRLHYKNQQVHEEGLVTAQILLSKPSTLRAVSATNTQNVVLGDDVVVNDKAARLHLSFHGNGHIFVGSMNTSFDVRSVGIVVSGDGGIQLQSFSLKVTDEVVVSLVGAGHVAVLATDNFVAAKVESAVAGTGKVIVQTAELQVESLATEIVGNGEVSYATEGTCNTEKIHLAGEGFVNAASIVCKSADVSILGIGQVIVQATERLSTTLLLTGSVRYVNTRPKSIQSSGLVLGSSIKQADAIPSAQYLPLSSPTRAPTGVFLTVEVSNNDDSPYVHVAIAVMAFVVVSVLRFQQRRVRNKYQTLLP
ncbi:putative auto-transporter adhesin head GIN domain-containing protein [Phytophthora infestans]|uniref:Putative auto-transporter adhesin head GIN domain-containing protein n=1 Tax=Phytophthora infestans TaxID=4787 RepID=A0A8S9U548_PHYIN|nr:putative auto-transporter adhesin head GIN domain-containing protein [Phytophthora infestans]